MNNQKDCNEPLLSQQKRKDRNRCCVGSLFFVGILLGSVFLLKGCDPSVPSGCFLQKHTFNATITRDDYQSTACRSACHLYNDDLAEMRQQICPDSSSAPRVEGLRGLHFTMNVAGTSNACHQDLISTITCRRYVEEYQMGNFPRKVVTYNPNTGRCYFLITAKGFWWTGFTFLILTAILVTVLVIRCTCVRVVKNITIELN